MQDYKQRSSFTTIKEIEELQNAIKRMGAKWKELSNKVDESKTYKGVLEKLNSLNYFLVNEKNDIDEKEKELLERYSVKEVARRKEELMTSYGEQALELIDSVKEEVEELTKEKIELIGDMLTTAPTDAQLNLLKVLEMRDDIEAIELQSIVSAFFDNYNSLKTLQKIAKSNGVDIVLPAKLDIKEMFINISKAHDYLIGACDLLGTKRQEMPLQYHAFFTIDENNKDVTQDPIYREFVDTLDNVAQLQEVKTKKTSLSPSEKVKVDYYFKDVSDEDIKSVRVLKHTQEIMQKYPNDIELLKLSKYKDVVKEVEEAEKDND